MIRLVASCKLPDRSARPTTPLAQFGGTAASSRNAKFSAPPNADRAYLAMEPSQKNERHWIANRLQVANLPHYGFCVPATVLRRIDQ